MKKFLLTALSVAIFAAASSAADVTKRLVKITDSENGVPESDITTFGYFPEGSPAAGLLQTVIDGDESVVFDYSRMASDKVVVITKTCTPASDGGTYLLNLGANGYVATATFNGNDGDNSSFAFTYDADGYLTAVSVTDADGTASYSLTWADGSVAASEESAGTPVETVKYAYSYAGILNPGALFLIDYFYDVDVEDIEYAAFSGLLGKAPAQLPVAVAQTEGNETFNGRLNWSTDADGYPAYFTTLEGRVTFTWETTTGVESVPSDADPAVMAIYGVDGTSRESLGHGINIVRLAGGKMQKVIAR